MPTYQYRCKECSRLYEGEQKMADAPFQECPLCLTDTLYRVMQPIGIAFKGTDFYCTTYPKRKNGCS